MFIAEKFIDKALITHIPALTRGNLMAQYGDIELDQHWFRIWPVVWLHQAITWTNVDLSVMSSDIHLGPISKDIPQVSINKTR